MIDWKPMFLARNDGSIILAISDDFSMVEPIYWGINDIHEGWFNAAENLGCISENDNYFAGWCDCPHTPAWENLISGPIPTEKP